jgi:hypothetical protein
MKNTDPTLIVCPFCKTDPCQRTRVCFGEKPLLQTVIFRASRTKAAEVSAVLVRQPGSYSAPLMVWDSSCGHGSATWGWYARTRPAKPSEYKDELARLQRQYAPEYEIQVVQKYTAKDRDALNAAFLAPAQLSQK